MASFAAVRILLRGHAQAAEVGERAERLQAAAPCPPLAAFAPPPPESTPLPYAGLCTLATALWRGALRQRPRRPHAGQTGLQPTVLWHWKREAEHDGLAAHPILRLTLVSTHRGRGRHLDRIFAHHLTHAAPTRYVPVREPAAVPHLRKRAVALFDHIDASRLLHPCRHLRAVPTDEVLGHVIGEVDACRHCHGRVFERYDIAFARPEVWVVEIEHASSEEVADTGCGRVRALGLHLEDAPVGAIFGLDLHDEADAATGQFETAVLSVDRQTARQREAARLGRLGEKHYGRVPAGEVQPRSYH